MVSGTGFFALESLGAEPDDGWLPFTDVRPDGPPPPRGDVEPRVHASLWFLGWSARLVSPWLGTAVVAGAVPLVPASSLWFLPSAQPVRLAVVGSIAWVEASLPTLYDACLGALVEPLLAATASAYSVSPQVMWGNVASSVVGAGTVLRQSADPGRVDAWVGGLLATGELSGRGDFTGTRFVRNSCCLMYRIPGAGLCGDCVLRTR